MLRSILEGVAQAVALGVEAVQESGDPMPDVVPLVGGGTHDPAFRQLLADASGLTLAVTDAPDSAVVGAALLAAGLASNPRPPGRTAVVTPEPTAMELLAGRRARWWTWRRPWRAHEDRDRLGPRGLPAEGDPRGSGCSTTATR